MSPEVIVALVGAAIVALTFVVIVAKLVLRRLPQKPRTSRYQKKWKALQEYCRDKEKWPKALSASDELLDEALKKRGFKGKNMGERLVSAQKEFTDNDGVWFAHKLTNKVLEDTALRLKEKDVKQALMNVRQALKDLGAL